MKMEDYKIYKNVDATSWNVYFNLQCNLCKPNVCKRNNKNDILNFVN